MDKLLGFGFNDAVVSLKNADKLYKDCSACSDCTDCNCDCNDCGSDGCDCNCDCH
jgi:hypothetical protein